MPAAPNVDMDLFGQLADAYDNLASRSTLYVSQNDLAITASMGVHGYERVGLALPFHVFPGIDTVDATNVDLSFLGHAYSTQARSVLADVYELIRKGTPPDERFGIRRSDDDRYRVLAP